MSSHIQFLLGNKKPSCHLNTKRYLLNISLLTAILSCNAHAVLSAVSAKTITGDFPRLNPMLEAQIQEGKDFDLLGIQYAGLSHFTQDSFASKLALSGLTVSNNKPSDIVVSPAFKLLPINGGIDNDGDTFGVDAFSEATTGAVKTAWYYLNNTGVETSLTAAQQGMTFCDLALQGISPYIKVQGPVSLKTTYGDPIAQTYPNPSIAITKIPQHKFSIELSKGACYASPSMRMASGVYDPLQPTKFNPNYGFIPQPLATSNFPSVGAKNLNFYLIVTGIKANSPNISWAATSTPLTSNVRAAVSTDTKLGSSYSHVDYQPNNMVVITLDGPDKNTSEIGAKAPSFSGPTTIKITGTDISVIPNRVMVTYEFQIKNWFIVRGSVPAGSADVTQHTAWCSGLGSYTLPTVANLTNGSYLGVNNYRRIVGGGLFSEWGFTPDYLASGLTGTSYWTTDKNGTSINGFLVGGGHGDITSYQPTLRAYAVCRSR